MSQAETEALARPARLIARARATGAEFWRYLLASAAALGLDFALLWLLTERLGLHYLASAAISYSAGAVLHYAISVVFVFRQRRVRDERLEFILFFAIGLFGLASTQLMLKLAVDGLGLSYMIGKLLATGVSFVLNYAARRVALFTVRRADA